MRLQFFIFFLFLHTQLLADHNDFKVGDTLFVWTDNGLNVRRQPNMESEVVAKLNYGDRIIIQEIIDIEVQYEIIQAVKIKNQTFPPIITNGKFIEINLSGSVGYVYSGLLSRLRPIKKGERFEAYLSRVFGQLNVVVDVRHENSDNRFKRIIYRNGAVLQEEHGNENWWNYLYIIPDITLGEAYLLINRLVGFESAYSRSVNEGSDWIETHPTIFKPNTIVLQSGPFEETHIKVESHYILITMRGGN